MTTAGRHTSFHHDGQFAIRVAPIEPVNPDASTWLAKDARPSPQGPKQPSRQVPQHPIVTMQGAFTESLDEASAGTLEQKPKLRPGDARARREALLDQDKTEGPPAALWRRRPGQKCHELRKLVAQISFGVYLLLNGMANSNAQVVAILQGHIDEVDEFLEVNMEDFNLATEDLTHRLDLLKLPMDNMQVFAQMLEDRKFRLQIVEGNVKIEHILSRTTTALVQADQDIAEGLQSTREFAQYLSEQQQAPWRQARPDVIDIFDAMRGNTEGWLNAFVDLQDRSNALDELVCTINSMISDMDRMAGEVSRQTRFSIQPHSTPTSPVNTPPRSSESPKSQRPSTKASQATATPSTSPSPKVAQLPPRLSLRFSSILGDNDAPLHLDLSEPGGLLQAATLAPTQHTPAELPAEPTADPIAELPAEPTAQPTAQPPSEARRGDKTQPDQPRLQVKTVEAIVVEDDDDDELDFDDLSGSEVEFGSESEPEAAEEALGGSEAADDHSTEMSSAVTKAESPASATKKEKVPPKTESPKEQTSLYMLQPRTYTPVPPAPLPSPCVHNISTKGNETESSSPGSARAQSQSPEAPTPQERSSRRQPAPESQPITAQRPDSRSDVLPQHLGRRPASQDNLTGRTTQRLAVKTDAESQRSSYSDEKEVVVEHGQGSDYGQDSARTSLRQRVSQRGTPPTSIQVPTADAPGLRPPTFASPNTFQNYRTFTGPEATRASEYGRPVTRSAIESGPGEFAPPAFPGHIPSPHSDQQFFRPVNASPHSPLQQQRPHTAAGRNSARPQAARGMSMLSTASAPRPNTPNGAATIGGATLKKKRSAFGWLKKAFTLDEEERMEFDARKLQQQRDVYIEQAPQKFLDGRRLR